MGNPILIPVMIILCFQAEMKSAMGNPSSDSQSQSQELEAARIFLKQCPPYNCSASGPAVKYPLHLKERPNNCSHGDLALSCSGNTTVIALSSGAYNVTRIDYSSSQIKVALQPWGGTTCLNPNNISLPDPSGTPFYYLNITTHVWLNCSDMLPPDYYNSLTGPVKSFMGPISCLSANGAFVYLASNYVPESTKFQSCAKFTEASSLDWYQTNPDVLEASLFWDTSGIPGDCTVNGCMWPDTECGLWLGKNQTLCYDPATINIIMHHSDSTRRIRRIASAVGIGVGIIILIIGTPVLFLIYQKHFFLRKR